MIKLSTSDLNYNLVCQENFYSDLSANFLVHRTIPLCIRKKLQF